MQKYLAAIAAVLLSMLFVLPQGVSANTTATPAPALAASTTNLNHQQPTSIVNFNATGQQVVRFDTNGNAVDAHDGQIAQFGDTYYLYGTSYDCGYQWGINSNFCGFKVYSSPDMMHWTDRGYVVTPYSCGACFRPHVLYDASTQKYVLWTNDQSAPGGSRVYTNSSPIGLFTQQNLPNLAYGACEDFGLFQDPGGRAYMVNTDCRESGLVVQQLNADDLSGDGQYAVLYTPGSVDAPAMFKRGGTYYITMSDPQCAYCTGTGTGYVTAPSPLGPWTGAGTSPGTIEWRIENGALYVPGSGRQYGIGLSAVGASWTDYTFAVDVTPLQSTSYAQAGLVTRMNDAGDGYAFLLSNYPYTSPPAPGYVVFAKFQNFWPVTIQPTPLPFAVIGGRTYHVDTKVSGSTLTVAVNGATVDTVTDSTYATGKVGFREFIGESAVFDNVRVTAPDGTILLADDFSGSLSQWDPPRGQTGTEPIVVNANSCGGQPSFVTTLAQQDGGTVYLYGSDLWAGKVNEGVANYFWAPLQFDAQGAIEPIQCSPSVNIDLATSHPGHQAPVAGLDQTSGVDGFSVACDIAGNTEHMQTFTAGRTGTLRQVQLTAFQQSTAWSGPTPNAPLTLRLVTLDAHGRIAGVMAQTTFDPNIVGFSARNLVMTPNVHVTVGTSYAVVASSTTTQGCYGIAENDTNPYPSGHAASSTDGGQTFTAAPARDLKFLTVLVSEGG